MLCFAGGGGARDDIASLLYVRPAAVLIITAILLLPGPLELRPIRVPLAICLAFAALMGVQLIPLPPELWTALPGRAVLADAAHVAGIPQPWRPISIAPDLTLNSLAALTIPLAALLGLAALDRDQRRTLLLVLIGVALVSAVMGILQAASGESSPFRLYRITNRDSAVGLFANRNHQAALLTLAFPIVATWASTAIGPLRGPDLKRILAASFAVFLIPMILVTGSRAGVLLGGAAALYSWYLYSSQARHDRRRMSRWKVTAGMLVIVVTAVAFSVTAFQRAESLQRMLAVDLQSDLRVGNTELLMNLAADQLAVGSGFGTFDALYRIHEPHETLTPFYLNHAHNDLLELAITGGLPALILLVVGLIWIAVKASKVIRGGPRTDPDVALGKLGLVIMVVMLVWSIVDYPLRTPSLAMVFAIAAGWLGTAPGLGSGKRRSQPNFA